MREIYQYPDLDDPENKKLVTLAAKVGRNFYNQSEYDKAHKKLHEFMQGLSVDRLQYWAYVVMIDPRWSGATGQGAYWAVASRVVNEIAQECLIAEGV